MKHNPYPIYTLEISDLGYFFKKNESSTHFYIKLKGKNVLSRNNMVAKSILVLGNGKLYVVLWLHTDGSEGLWFLDEQLNYITSKDLLAGHSAIEENVALIWKSYLDDIIFRIWVVIITPGLLKNMPDFSPQETFITNGIKNSVSNIVQDKLSSVKLLNVSEMDDAGSVYDNNYQSIKKEYLRYGLEWLSTGTDLWFDLFKNDSLPLLHNTENWQDRAIITGYIEIKNPISGEIIRSNQSIFFSSDGFTTAYRFEIENEAFFLFCSIHHNEKIGFYFPLRNLFVYSDHMNSPRFKEEDIFNFVAITIQSWQHIKPYLLNENIKKTVSCSRAPHLGHFFWNELTALERMERGGVLSSLHEYFTGQTESEHYGPLETLYPKLNNKVRRINLKHLPRYVYAGNYFYVRVSDLYIHQSLADKVIGYATNYVINRSQLSEEFCSFKAIDYNVIILFTLRFENRSWLDQEQGICEVIKKLSHEYEGKIALIIDGHNTNYSGENIKSHREHIIKKDKKIDLLDEEIGAAERIKSAISSESITVFNTIGCSLCESINWSLLCGFFVAPWGAGLAKYKWIANKPGLVFSSTKVLNSRSDLHIYDSPIFREATYPCEYIDSNSVIDIDEILSNFNLVINDLYDKIKILAEKYGSLRHRIHTID